MSAAKRPTGTIARQPRASVAGGTRLRRPRGVGVHGAKRIRHDGDLTSPPEMATLKHETLAQRAAWLQRFAAGIVALPTVHPTVEVVKRANAVAGAVRSHGLPAVLAWAAG